jgi:hypothetical protein
MRPRPGLIESGGLPMLKRDALDGDGGPRVRNWNANARKEPRKHANQSVPVILRGEPIHSVNLRLRGCSTGDQSSFAYLCGSLRRQSLASIAGAGRRLTQGNGPQMEPLFLVVA